MKTRVAVLGTLGELHQEPTGYDLGALAKVVREARPDLLCAEILSDEWSAQDLSGMPPEYRDALIPLSRRTDIVIVPVAGPKGADLIAPRGGRFLAIRTFLVGILNAHIRWMQTGNRGVRALNSGLWGTACDRLCSLTARLCGREARREWDATNRALFDNVAEAIRRDPESRVLVTVDCRRRHRLERALAQLPAVELTDYRQL